MGRPRRLTEAEIAVVLEATVPIHLATVDGDGFPHVTPLWFEWDGTAFWMTSLVSKPHVRRLRANSAASVCLDVEDGERVDGERPNRQVRGVGRAELVDDVDGEHTRRITARYVIGPGRDRSIEQRGAVRRVAIRLEPAALIAVASV
jgi:nitroimidazol reductase NimA-like FMN-containing flavoprotein (pyridoxamine 5'-phosphate oxidase superfamily)